MSFCVHCKANPVGAEKGTSMVEAKEVVEASGMVEAEMVEAKEKCNILRAAQIYI